ncbi:MAG TPA: prolipoprotein diacylglyceryl transferase [Jatrophihabitans sp.]|uniref:prolipoprotein diacylglyceryl transferase n=1 Tax=Jatrophihabitans sp. TaxID=1932789 RepID=UPI002F18E8F0
MQTIQAAIPSPTVSAIRLGPFTVHLYALCIVAGILVAIWLTDRRWRARGGAEHQVGDVAGWAVLFGILGGRLYHVITDPQLYFGSGKNPVDALRIWDGGLGIWGAIALGALGAWIGCRRHKMNFPAFADCAAPAILLAQAIGRWGNWFNNELYGRATTLPWKLQIHELEVGAGKVSRDAEGNAVVLGYFHPTFLYEMLWSLAVVAVLLWADHRRLLARGQVLALYLVGYTFGRFWVELLRDDAANRILGLRVNSWVSMLVFLLALAWFLRLRGGPRSVAGLGRSAGEDPSRSAGKDPSRSAGEGPAQSSDAPSRPAEDLVPAVDLAKPAGPAGQAMAAGDRPAGAGSNRPTGADLDSNHVQQHAQSRSPAPGAADGDAPPDR